MDEKSLSEIRRKKLLENAEARLRFIKEGIPWRNNENNSTEASQPDDNLKKNQDLPLTQDDSELTGIGGSASQTPSKADNDCPFHATTPSNERLNSVNCKYNHMDTSSGKDNIMSSATFIREEGGNSSNVITEKTDSKNENISDVQSADENFGGSLNPSLHADENKINTEIKDPEVKLNGPTEKTNESEVTLNNPTEKKTNEIEVKSNDHDEKKNDSDVKSNDDEKTIETEVKSNDPTEKTNENEVNSVDNELEMNDLDVISDDIKVIPIVPQGRRIDRRGLIPEELVRNIKALLCESSNEREEQKRRNREIDINIWTSLFIMLCLGVITRISYAVGLSWLFKGVMLVPFFTVAVPRLIPMVLNPPPPSGPLVQFLLMVGVKLKLLKQVFTVFSVMRMFLKLFSVFLIAFVFTHQVVESLSA